MFGIYSYYLLLKVGPGREKKILATYLAGEHIKLPSILTREVHVDHHRITLSSFSLLGILRQSLALYSKNMRQIADHRLRLQFHFFVHVV